MFNNLSFLEFITSIYLSLYIGKLMITWPVFYTLAKTRIDCQHVKVPKGFTIKSYAKILQKFYFLGALLTLIVLLLPTLYRERLSFFKPYPPGQIELFVKTGQWS